MLSLGIVAAFTQQHPAGAAPAQAQRQPHAFLARGQQNTQPVGASGIPLTYHNGPVMKSPPVNYAIFWEPPTLQDGSSASVSATYHSLINRYFGDVGNSNLYQTNTQYYDTGGHIQVGATFGGAWVDTSAYPTSDCVDSYTPSNCIIDTDIQAEVQRAITANHWTTGLNHMFFVFTSKNEGSCFSASSPACAFTYYCAYHSAFSDNNSQPVVYANMPYTGTRLNGCGVPAAPNDDADADSTINVTSHEQMEAVTDPIPDETHGAWYDAEGEEIGDKCAWNFGTESYDSGKANEQWNGHYYNLQQEWSNQDNGCVQGSQVTPSGTYAYVGSNDKYVYAYNTSNGAFAWKYKTGGAVTSSPVVSKGNVYVGSLDGYVYALDGLKGTLLWKYHTGGPVYSSPLIVGSSLYIGSNDGNLYKLNVSDGSKSTSFSTGKAILSTPIFVDSVLMFSSTNGSLYGLKNDKQAWKYAIRGATFASPTAADGMVYVGSSNGSLYALDDHTGQYVWSYRTGRTIAAIPTVASGIVYCGSTNGTFYALSAKRGVKSWSYSTRGSIASQANITSGVVYFGSANDYIYAINIKSHAVVWNYKTASGVLSSPAVVKGVVYIGSNDHNLYALNATTGAHQWHGQTSDAVVSSPAVYQFS